MHFMKEPTKISRSMAHLSRVRGRYRPPASLHGQCAASVHCAGVLRNLFGVTQLIIDSDKKNVDDCTKTYDLQHARGRRRRRADATSLARDKPQAKQIECGTLCGPRGRQCNRMEIQNRKWSNKRYQKRMGRL